MKLMMGLIFLLSMSFVNAEVYTFSGKKKGIEFLVSKNKKRDNGTFGKTDVLGELSKFKGQVEYLAGGNISNLMIDVEMSSVDTGIEKRNKHLRTEDFFHVDKYKYSHFKSEKGKKFQVSKSGTVRVKGKLKIKDTEKDITLVLLVSKRANSLKISSPKEFSVSIDRREYNVKHNMKVSEGMLGGLIGKFKNYVGQNVIGNTVAIRMNIDASKK